MSTVSTSNQSINSFNPPTQPNSPGVLPPTAVEPEFALGGPESSRWPDELYTYESRYIED